MEEEKVKFLKPEISIKYFCVPANDDNNDDFESIPDNAFGACIEQKWPVVVSFGSSIPFPYIYHFYVGEELTIDEELEKDIDEQKRKVLLELKANGCRRAVIPTLNKSTIIPLNYNDRSFKTHQEMIAAIIKVYEMWLYLNMVFKNDQNIFHDIARVKRKKHLLSGLSSLLPK